MNFKVLNKNIDKKILKKIVFLIIFVTALSFGVYIYQGSTNKVSVQKQKCPDDYADTDAGSVEYLAAMDKWTNNFFDDNLGATLIDWSNARYEFWVENGCVAAIQRYWEAKEGRADPETMARIDDVIRDMTDDLAQ